ncbi:hypothetical protein [Rhodococcus jostii]|uniref:hypothetical protein n=1 Tax=Rhodococcus jostii TaxID=132919 RepID=UPI00363C722A
MGLFNRGEAITGMVLDHQPAIHAYHGQVLVWDGTRQAFVSVTRAVATTAARIPDVTADSVPDTATTLDVAAAVLTPALSATAIADPTRIDITVLVTQPVVSADSLILAEVITCAAQALPAAVAEAHDGAVSAVPAEVETQTVSPAVDSSLATLPPTIVVSADMPTPVVTVTGSGTVDAVVATATAQAGTPTLTAAGRVTAVAATASASANTPVAGGGATVAAVTGTGTAAVTAPQVSSGLHFTDTFTRANANLTTPWVRRVNWSGDDFAVISNQLYRTGSGGVDGSDGADAYIYGTPTATGKQYAQITATTMSSYPSVGVVIGSNSTGTATALFGEVATNGWRIYTAVPGVGTKTILASGSGTYTAPGVIRLEQNTATTATLYFGGVPLGSTSGTTLPNGLYTGVHAGKGSCRSDDWAGGDF